VLVRLDAQKRSVDLLPVVDAPTVRTVALARIQRLVVDKAGAILVKRVLHENLLRVRIDHLAPRVIREDALDGPWRSARRTWGCRSESRARSRSWGTAFRLREQYKTRLRRARLGRSPYARTACLRREYCKNRSCLARLGRSPYARTAFRLHDLYTNRSRHARRRCSPYARTACLRRDEHNTYIQDARSAAMRRFRLRAAALPCGAPQLD
jgi:hypothetical protein